MYQMLCSPPYTEYLTYSYKVGTFLSSFYRWETEAQKGKQCVQVLTG